MAKKKKQDDRVMFALRVPRRVLTRIDKTAADLGISRNSICERILAAATDPKTQQATESLFGVLGLEEVIKQAAESALLEATRRLGRT